MHCCSTQCKALQVENNYTLKLKRIYNSTFGPSIEDNKTENIYTAVNPLITVGSLHFKKLFQAAEALL